MDRERMGMYADIPGELYEWAKGEAARKKTSMSDVITLALNRYRNQMFFEDIMKRVDFLKNGFDGLKKMEIERRTEIIKGELRELEKINYGFNLQEENLHKAHLGCNCEKKKLEWGLKMLTDILKDSAR